jgi:hypothetical protein
MATSDADPDAVAARLSVASARLKAVRDEADEAIAALEVPAFDDVRAARLPARTDAALARLQTATHDLQSLQADLAALRAGMEALAAHLRTR